MAALSEDTSRPRRQGDVIARVPLQASKTVYVGSLLEIDGSGNVQPATKAASKEYFGVALTPAKSGAAAGSASVDVARKGTFHFTKTGTAVRGKTAYVEDDNTVTDAASGRSSAGTIVDIDSDGVWVELD